MATAQRRPLLRGDKENRPVQSVPPRRNGGLSDPVMDVNANEGLTQGALKVKRSVSELKRDLAKAQAKFSEKALNHPLPLDIPLTSTPNDSFESKFQHLIEKHQSSKVKYTARVDELNAVNDTLHKACTAANAELEAARSEISNMSRELLSLRQKAQQAKDSTEGKEAEGQQLQKEIEILTSENARLIQREDQVEAMETEREWLETVVDTAAKQCGRDHLFKVERRESERVKAELEVLKMERSSHRSEEYGLRHDLRTMIDDLAASHHRIAQLESERRLADEVLDDLLEQRRLDRETGLPRPLADLDNSDLSTIPTSQEVDQLEHCHTRLELSATRFELRATLESQRRLMIKYDTATDKLNSAETSLNALQKTRTQLEAKCDGLEAVRENDQQRLMSSQQEVSRWQHAESTASAQLAEVKSRLSRLEITAKGDRESLRRANDSVMRAKSAEEVLAEQVAQLSEALDQAAPYEDLYHALVEENHLLMTRESLAAEEAEKMGLRNAELLSHANSDQKISYVETVRREMAIAKHELASTRHQLNQANDKISSLLDENEAYKSVGGGLGLNASTRTRVVRRVPEGTYLGKSVRGTGRSVSGPISR